MWRGVAGPGVPGFLQGQAMGNAATVIEYPAYPEIENPPYPAALAEWPIGIVIPVAGPPYPINSMINLHFMPRNGQYSGKSGRRFLSLAGEIQSHQSIKTRLAGDYRRGPRHGHDLFANELPGGGIP
jgi:hypothetical protein